MKFSKYATVVCVCCCASATPTLAQNTCGQWSAIDAPSPELTDSAIIRDIAAISPTDVWAVGGYTQLVQGQLLSYAFSMNWDGKSWTMIPTPQPSACPVCTNVTLWAVDAIGPNDVWAAGDKKVQAPDGFLGTHMMVMHWDGSSWTVMNTPIQSGASGDILWGVEAIAPNDVWFFGEGIYPGSPNLPQPALAMHWNGSSFQITSVPIVNFETSGFGNGNSLHDGSALASNDMWAVGAGSDGDSILSPLSQIHHWNGTTWTHVSAGPMPGYWNDLDAVVAIAPDDVWAGGEYFDGAYHGIALHYDGTSWMQVPIPGGVRDMFAFGSNDVYAVGGGIYHWDGQLWSEATNFPAINSPTYAGVDAAGPCELWAGGRHLVGTQMLNFTAHLNPSPPPRPADITADGVVNVSDLLMVINSWGACAAPPSACPADIAPIPTRDGIVNVADLLMVIDDWG